VKPEYLDIHSHLHFEAFNADRDEVMKRTLLGGVWMINVGTQKKTSQDAVMLSEQYDDGVYATVGLHPMHTEKSYHDKNELPEGYNGEVFDTPYYRQLAKHRKVVGIGECGLDYYRLSKSTKEKQIKAFLSQINLANELQKPLMLHIRPSQGSYDAYIDAYEILKSDAKVKGNVHFFVGDEETAKKFWNLGFTTSFTGVITFTHDYDDVIKHAPLDMIMAETDCPYVAPVPERGKRNEPLFVKEIVKRIAYIKNMEEGEIKASIMKTASAMFRIDI